MRLAAGVCTGQPREHPAGTAGNAHAASADGRRAQRQQHQERAQAGESLAVALPVQVV